MAHARTTNKDARFLEQEARGRRTRYMWSKWIKIAQDRADDTSADSAITADIISNQTVRIPLGFAPCNGKIVRCTTNATQWIETGTGGSVVAGFYKANIGATDTLISLGGGTLTDGTGTATGSPITLVPGANTPTITVAGTFVVNLPVGVTGTAVTDGWTVTGSPVALVAGNNTVTVQVGGVGTITVTVNGLTMSWVTAGTALTAETAIDVPMSTTSSDSDLIEGQLVYAAVNASNHTIAAKSLGLLIACEFVPTDVRD